MDDLLYVHFRSKSSKDETNEAQITDLVLSMLSLDLGVSDQSMNDFYRVVSLSGRVLVFTASFKKTFS